MISQDLLTKIMGNENTLTQLFDEVRIIAGGGTHKICDIRQGQIVPTEKMCFSFWNRSEKCKNCVSKQAMDANQQMVKLEFCKDKYYFVIAKPIVYAGEKYIVEFMTNITTKMTGENEKNEDENFVNTLIQQLEKVSNRDTFSGLYNKNYIQRVIETRLSQNHGEACYFALLDINHFKLVNDIYSHALGDEVILGVAKSLKKRITNEIGLVGRFGGDEFCILFNSSDLEVCSKILEECEIEIHDNLYHGMEEDFKITVATGLEDVSGCNDFRQVIYQVDQKLYFAKENKPTFESRYLSREIHQGDE